MLDISLLGTGGMLPLPYRALTSLMVRYNGSSILIDAGEGTQTTIRQLGWSFNPIDVILITHFHADHVSGLPGLLLTIGNSERTKPVTIVGPRGIAKVVASLRVIAPELPFDIEFIELDKSHETFELCGLKIDAFKVSHSVVCYGYSISLSRLPKFDVEKARSLEIPVKIWSKLQNGENISCDGIEYTSDMVMGEERKGLKLTYCTDTRPTDAIVTHAMDSDLFICEGMYAGDDMIENAKAHKHMTMSEAARLAKAADVKEMWLTHFSPVTAKPLEHEQMVREIFPKTIIGKDRMTTTLSFEEE